MMQLTDEQWFAQISGKATGTPRFPLPDADLQTSTVGRSGEPILRDAYMFWQFCQQQLRAEGNGIGHDTKVLDFGCAWGRIIRYWLRDIEPQNLYGFDVEERFLKLAREHVPGPTYTLSKAAPPLPAPAEDNTFDLIYAFSVFSHLPEKLTNQWIAEFARILRPGGIACLTTRPRAHIDQSGNASTKHAAAYARLFNSPAEALARYDAGEFIFVPEHGGGGLSAETYGEAVIPASYAKNWSQLELVGFFEKYSATYLQPCFVLRKPF